MRFCHVCGSELAPDAATCPICGTAVTNQPTPQPQAPVPPPVLQAPMQQPVNTQPPKKEKKKHKHLALKITAAVLAFIILATGGLFLADHIMYKNEIEAGEYITDFPVLKRETDFVVFDEVNFPYTDYSIKVERVLYGGVLKSEMFKQTKIIIDDTSTDPVYHIDFEEDGEYIITLEDNTDKEENTTSFSTATDTDSMPSFSTATDSDFSTATDTDEDEDEDEAPSKITILVTVEDGNKEAVGSVNLDSKPGDDPVEIPSDETETEPETLPDIEFDEDEFFTDTPEEPSVDAYARDAQIYTAYLTGGELDNLTEYMDKSYVEIESCMADLNNDGTYELLISARNSENLGVRGYETNYACYTINNGSVIKLEEAYYGGGSMGGDNLVFKYDSFLGKYIIMKTSLIRDGSWANSYYCYAYDIIDGQLEMYIHTTSGFVSTNNDTYGPRAEEIKSETDLYVEDEHGVYYWSANDSYISEEEYDRTLDRFTDPTDSTYQMKVGTLSNPLGL